MKIRNIKIATQMIISFVIVIVIVSILGVVSYQQSSQIFEQAETLYNHPFQVTSEIGDLKEDILTIQLAFRDFILAQSEADHQNAKQLIGSSDADAMNQFNSIGSLYLGPHANVDEAYKSYINWKNALYDSLPLILAGQAQKVEQSISSTGTIGILSDKLFSNLHIIEDFASNKADSLHANYITLNDNLHQQLLILIGTILFLTFLIYFILIRNIRKPLTELTDVTRRFHQGDMNVRSFFESKNEFGILSASLNTMVDTIQTNFKLSDAAAKLSSVMLSQEDAGEFFRETLCALAEQTESQMAAVYLLSDDKKRYEYFDSIGMNEKARVSFDAESPEGEFGMAVSSGKIQYISNIHDNTRFRFITTGGQFVPHELITIPVVSGGQMLAVITLASLGKFSAHSIKLIKNSIDTMSARMAGVLAYRTIKEITNVLEQQNRELDAQKNELSSQTTELTQQNIELELQTSQLAEASRLKTNFLSNMSHELRTPLNSVIALSGVLKRRLANVIPDEEHSYLEVIERNGKELLLLINDILDISRIEAGHEKIEIAEINIGSLIDDVVSMIQPQAKLKNIELCKNNIDTEMVIASDADKVRHILQNIIGNAVKFTEKGNVNVSCRKNGEQLDIIIADTGIGIDQKDLPYIFDEFRQADGGTSRRFGGTGLGLAIANKYAGMLGGTIAVSSASGKGSVFTISLSSRPITEKENVEGHTTVELKKTFNTQVQINPEIDLSNKTILLVEDSEPVIIQIKDLFEESGYWIQIAHNGEEALERIDQVIPDAVILDLMMPGIDGFEVLKTIREKESTNHVPVLILTAKHITKEELNFLKSNHVHQLIQKGDVNRTELLNSVISMLCPETVQIPQPDRTIQTIEGKPIVLVVEDNIDNMITAKALLEPQYTVLEAADGIVAVEMAKKHLPNLILMDISLPGKDGIQAFREIRGCLSSQHIPVIALTASAMTLDREVILSDGFDAFIPKPINEIEFYKVISEVLYDNE